MVPYFLQRLELDAAADERAIRRAYARELKKIDQEADPAGFQALRDAYEAALQWAKQPKQPTAVPNFAATDFVSPTAYATPFYVQPKVVPQLTKEPAPPSAPNEKDDAMALATAAFTRFMETFPEPTFSATAALDAGVWQTKLEQFLAGDDLINIAARDFFERKFAQFLSQGWKPGHEVLFVVAAKVFRWDEDRRHLRGLGGFGFMLERALQERALFDRQRPNEHTPQLVLIQRLRNPAEPSHKELNSSIALLEKLERNFPAWLKMITDTNQISRWRELYNAMPAKARKTPKIAQPQPKSTGSIPWWAIMILIGVLSNAARMFDNHSTLEPISSFQQEPGSKKIQETLARMPLQNPQNLAGSSLPSSSGSDSLVPLPPLSKKTIATLTKKAPTEEVCNEVFLIASKYEVGRTIRAADPGPAFDRQIVACVAKKHWPVSHFNDPSVHQALEREKARIEADFKQAQKDILGKPLVIEKPKSLSIENPLAPAAIVNPEVIAVPKNVTKKQRNYLLDPIPDYDEGNNN